MAEQTAEHAAVGHDYYRFTEVFLRYFLKAGDVAFDLLARAFAARQHVIRQAVTLVMLRVGGPYLIASSSLEDTEISLS